MRKLVLRWTHAKIELDMLDHLRNIGFNRISMGVQDFNKAVQKAVNREQDEEFVNALLVRAREFRFPID